MTDNQYETTENNTSLSEEFFSEPIVETERSNMPVVRQLVVVSFILLGVFSIGATSVILSKIEKQSGDNPNIAASSAAIKEGEEKSSGDPFADLKVNAKSAIVIDLQTDRVLYQKEPDLKWPLASITKLMTALVAREIVEEGSSVQITKEAIGQAGESGFTEGERFSYRNLSDMMLLTSSNDGAYALAAAAGSALNNENPADAFVRAMNVRAKEIGLTKTYFRNPTGLDITEDEAGAYGTAREVAVLMEYLLENYPEILEETNKKTSTVNNTAGDRYETENTNRMIDAIATSLGSKTGYTTLAGGNLVVAFDAGINRPVVVVVLGSSHQGRFSDVLRLVEASRQYLGNE